MMACIFLTPLAKTCSHHQGSTVTKSYFFYCMGETELARNNATDHKNMNRCQSLCTD